MTVKGGQKSKPGKSMSTRKRPIRRRDGAGHIDPRYARELLAKARETRNDGDSPEAAHAFLKGNYTSEPLARELGEGFIEGATAAEDSDIERRDRVTPDELGGPFVVTSAGEEFAPGTDESNTADALREPLPRTSKAEP